MPRPLRVFHPDTVYETSIRTMQGRHLLAPSPAANELMLGVLGRALALQPEIRLHAFAFLADELTMLVSADHGDAIPAFANHVHGNLARELGALHDWPGPFWATRYDAVPVLDDQSLVARFKHMLGRGISEGVVTAPRRSPWPSPIPGLLGQDLSGVWFFRNREYRDRQVGRQYERYRHAIRYPVRLAPLPCWRELDELERRARIDAFVDDLETDVAIVAALDRGLPRPPVVPPTDPHARPERARRPLSSRCHARSVELWYTFRSFYESVTRQFRRAAGRLRDAARRDAPAAISSIGFPSGMFPPRLPHVRSTEPLMRSLDPLGLLPRWPAAAPPR